MTDRATQLVTTAGIAPTYAAASGGGDRFTPAAGTLLHVKNGSGSSITGTIVTPATSDGLAVADQTFTVPANSDRFVKPVADRLLVDVEGMAAITWSSPTSVTWAALHA